VDYGKAIESDFLCGACGKQFTDYKSPKEIQSINSELRRLNELKKKTPNLT